MATYFHGGPDIQANTSSSDHLQTLYLMNPNYLSSYSDTTNNNTPHNNSSNNNNNENPHNMLFINHFDGPKALLHHAPPPHQQLVGIPLAGTHTDSHHGRPSSSEASEIISSLHGLGVPSRVHYNLWGPIMDPSPAQHGPIQMATQGLSLSLSSQRAVGTTLGDDGRVSVTMAAAGGSSVPNQVQGVVLGSKYLKAAQELLDEVVNVGDFNKGESSGVHKAKVKVADPTSYGFGGDAIEGGSTATKKAVEQLTNAQLQELQVKKAKLLNMLDEVEQKYRQYHTQIQMVISFFEQTAGIGSAKSYTSIALKTISRQFRCLKDTITSQIKSTSKRLGEDDKNDGGSAGEGGGVGSRLRFVDHQLRQQRALQQLGMMHHNAWRPQRGLPERAVSVLRAWLFEHFLHPYPKDSDKHMLAKQTGLTRSQVSNWFINARVRLWKPMVEEMYAEEVKTQDQFNNGTVNHTTTTTTTTTTNPETTNTSISDQNRNNSHSKQPTITHHQQHPNTSIIHRIDHNSTNDMITAISTSSSQGFSLIGSSSDMESLMGRTPKKQRNGSEIQQNSPSNSILSMDMEMKPLDNNQHQTNKYYTQDDQRQAHIINNGSGFNPYLVQEMGRFNPDPLPTHHYSGNGVSLTLGLPHCENLSLGNQQDFISQGMNLGRRLDIEANEADFCGIGMGQQTSHSSNNGYDSIDIQSRTRFGAHLLHDFVA